MILQITIFFPVVRTSKLTRITHRHLKLMKMTRFVSSEKIMKLITNFESKNNERYVIRKRFINVTPFFETPINSKMALNIIIVSEISKDTEVFNVTFIGGKYCRFPIEDKYILLPILHEPCKIAFC